MTITFGLFSFSDLFSFGPVDKGKKNNIIFDVMHCVYVRKRQIFLFKNRNCCYLWHLPTQSRLFAYTSRAPINVLVSTWLTHLSRYFYCVNSEQWQSLDFAVNTVTGEDINFSDLSSHLRNFWPNGEIIVCGKSLNLRLDPFGQSNFVI